MFYQFFSVTLSYAVLLNCQVLLHSPNSNHIREGILDLLMKEPYSEELLAYRASSLRAALLPGLLVSQADLERTLKLHQRFLEVGGMVVLYDLLNNQLQEQLKWTAARITFCKELLQMVLHIFQKKIDCTLPSWGFLFENRQMKYEQIPEAIFTDGYNHRSHILPGQIFVPSSLSILIGSCARCIYTNIETNSSLKGVVPLLYQLLAALIAAQPFLVEQLENVASLAQFFVAGVLHDPDKQCRNAAAHAAGQIAYVTAQNMINHGRVKDDPLDRCQSEKSTLQNKNVTVYAGRDSSWSPFIMLLDIFQDRTLPVWDGSIVKKAKLQDDAVFLDYIFDILSLLLRLLRKIFSCCEQQPEIEFDVQSLLDNEMLLFRQVALAHYETEMARSSRRISAQQTSTLASSIVSNLSHSALTDQEVRAIAPTLVSEAVAWSDETPHQNLETKSFVKTAARLSDHATNDVHRFPGTQRILSRSKHTCSTATRIRLASQRFTNAGIYALNEVNQHEQQAIQGHLKILNEIALFSNIDALSFLQCQNWHTKRDKVNNRLHPYSDNFCKSAQLSDGETFKRGDSSVISSDSGGCLVSESGAQPVIQNHQLHQSIDSSVKAVSSCESTCLAKNAMEDEVVSESIAAFGHGTSLRNLEVVQSLNSLEPEALFKCIMTGSFMVTLLEFYLFPAVIAQAVITKVGSTDSLQQPLCQDEPTRNQCAAFITRVCTQSSACRMVVQKWLSSYVLPELQQQISKWRVLPPIARRTCAVGLENAAATCYMNSIFQSLFSQPIIREFVLCIDDSLEQQYLNELQKKQQQQNGITQVSQESKDCSNENMTQRLKHSTFHEFQRIFAYLAGSQQQSYRPESFWNTFLFYGQPVNPREQMDVAEFFQNFADQIDSYLKRVSLPPIFEWMCGGVFSDEKIVRSCGCRSVRDQPFVLLPVAVRNNATLEEALAETIREESIEEYYCEKCETRDTALKRMCVARLPRTLVVHLKRFDFDWAAQETVKFNDKFVFPDILDMYPYTTHGAHQQGAGELSTSLSSSSENISNVNSSTKTPNATSHSSPENIQQSLQSQISQTDIWKSREDRTLSCSSQDSASTSSMSTAEDNTDSHEFKLHGVVVHMGNARAGHYYAYARVRETLDSIEENTSGKWIKFNDNRVEYVEMTQALKEDQFYGGDHLVSTDYGHTSKNYSAYLLIYERKDVLKRMASEDSILNLLDRLADEHLIPKESVGHSHVSPLLRDQTSNSIESPSTRRDTTEATVICDKSTTGVLFDQKEALISPTEDKDELKQSILEQSLPIQEEEHLNAAADSAGITQTDRLLLTSLFKRRANSDQICESAEISELLCESNLRFNFRRAVFSEEMFRILSSLLSSIDDSVSESEVDLVLTFYFDVFLHLHKSLRCLCPNMTDSLIFSLRTCTKVHRLCLRFLVNRSNILPNFVLECDDQNVREEMFRFLRAVLGRSAQHDDPMFVNFQEFLVQTVMLLQDKGSQLPAKVSPILSLLADFADVSESNIELCLHAGLDRALVHLLFGTRTPASQEELSTRNHDDTQIDTLDKCVSNSVGGTSDQHEFPGSKTAMQCLKNSNPGSTERQLDATQRMTLLRGYDILVQMCSCCDLNPFSCLASGIAFLPGENDCLKFLIIHAKRHNIVTSSINV